MSDYLTPAEVEHWVAMLILQRDSGIGRKAATLREMAAIVETVATMQMFPSSVVTGFISYACPHCFRWALRTEDVDHKPECPYLRARKLRGLEP